LRRDKKLRYRNFLRRRNYIFASENERKNIYITAIDFLQENGIKLFLKQKKLNKK